MKRIRTTLAMMTLVLCSVTLNAHDFRVGEIFYEIISEEEGTIAVTYEGTDKYNPDSYYTGEIRIPDHVSYYGRKYTVTRIGERAFQSCDSLISVLLPESIERIEELDEALLPFRKAEESTTINKAIVYSTTNIIHHNQVP
jgi:hypothetical protein